MCRLKYIGISNEKYSILTIYLYECCSYAIAPYKNCVQFFEVEKRLNSAGFRQSVSKVCSFVIVAEQKARATYDNILRVSDDPDVNDVIRYLRQREIVHFQRFGEALDMTQNKMNEKKVIVPGMNM